VLEKISFRNRVVTIFLFNFAGKEAVATEVTPVNGKAETA
jgi:hypothetical protein